MRPFQQKQRDLMRQMEQSLASGSDASTIVPFQSNYITDRQMCLSLNTFVPETIGSIIEKKLIEPLRKIDPAQYYYPIDALHVTLHSIRIIHYPPTYSAKDIETSKQLLTKYIPSQRAFPFVLQGLLSMPTSVSIIVLITPEYDRFIKALRQAFVASGIPDDKKYFTDETVFANTTICRYTHKPSAQFLEKISELKDTYVGTFTAKEVALLETNAGAHPTKTRIFGYFRFKEN